MYRFAAAVEELRYAIGHAGVTAGDIDHELDRATRETLFGMRDTSPPRFDLEAIVRERTR